MKKIDLATWERKTIYEHFRSVSNPFYMVTFTLDVSGIYAYAKAHNCSFYCSMIWVCSQALNSVENFRYTIRQGEIWLLDKRQPSFTDLKKGSELFHITNAPLTDDIEEFCRDAVRLSAAQDFFLDTSGESDDLIYFSCSPILRVTAVTNERDLNDPATAESNIPSLAWGKFVDNNGRKELNLSMEVNHRFIDGIHIGKFATEFERLAQTLA